MSFHQRQSFYLLTYRTWPATLYAHAKRLLHSLVEEVKRKRLKRIIYQNMNLVVPILHGVQVVFGVKVRVRYFLSTYFFTNDSPSKTIKNVFYFNEKVLFVLYFFSFFAYSPDSKGQMEVE